MLCFFCSASVLCYMMGALHSASTNLELLTLGGLDLKCGFQLAHN